MSDDLEALAKFSGVARLFPLPNLVLFPQVIQPLHIFEARYRQMTAHSLADDHLLALALLRPGWESDYDGGPPIYPTVCLGRVIADQRLDDGRYNLLVRGLKRARIVEELQTGFLYRSARVELLEDDCSLPTEARSSLRRELAERAPRWFPAQPQVQEQFSRLFESELSLGTLCDVFGFALPLPIAFKQELLETLSVEQRIRRLLAHLATQSPPEAAPTGDRRFPPEFSEN